jgi:hypothetical protein
LFFVSERSSFFPISFAAELDVAFMPVESQRFTLAAAWEKLRVCYRSMAKVLARTHRAGRQLRRCAEKRSGAYGIRTRDLLNAIEALYQLS